MMEDAAQGPSGSESAPPTGALPIADHLHALATETDVPEAALRSCVARIDEAGPALRAVLGKAADGAALNDEEALLVFRGLYVLGAARDAAAFRPLLRLLHLPAGPLDDLLGDALSTDLIGITAGVFDGDVDALLDATTDLSIDDFVRHSLLQAATFLTWDGSISRDRMKDLVLRISQEKLFPPEDMAWNAWADAISLLGWRELLPLVEQAFDCGDFPAHVMDFSDFQRHLAQTERAPEDGSRFEDNGLAYIDDVAEALAWTQPRDPTPLKLPSPSQASWQQVSGASRKYAAAAGSPAPFWQDGEGPYVNPMRDVGRNDPCPCGSGKKAKKCCLAN